ncbi:MULTISPECIES: hypothetical protein [Aliivibrio]|uniref:hypothetical protein n=1 Tax=Aliivibrio TaxID=511678 RepID=UPI0002FA45D3|nr:MULTISPECIES: hypothetical protein [Aliivibrio]MBD1569564.1 hypothetical protein [Aliivibrio sp. S10_S31]OCH01561.1 hypothetical protein A6E10_18495 [Aliivibrio fischeri]OCH21128.1 hypothetical protein A6E12_04190 [Aliivibrio fischeri]OCH36743.1 hypothetical protein A6D99_14110 [Aliivibrio fischeri]OCH60738.1 hypothetical protein A6D98_10310 [Aliivibrio fischeri]
MKQYFKIAVVASALMSVVGCQSTNEEATAVEQTSEINTPVVSTFEALQKQYNFDKTVFDSAAEFKIYSEDSYSLMMDEWNEAKEIYLEVEQEPALINEEYSMFSSGSYSAKYIALIKNANLQLDKLKTYKNKADTVLSDAIAQMNYMQSIDVAKYYPQDFSSLYNQYKALFVTVIEEDIAEAQTEQAEFLTKAKVIEIDTSLTIHVKPLEKEFSQLTQKGFKAIAPISYGQTKAELDKTKKAVQANNRDQDLIADVVAKTRFQLDHLKNMAAEVKLLKAVKNGQFEQSVLEFENKLLSISQAINGDDYRDQPLRMQTTEILSAVQQMHAINNTADLEKKIKELNSEIETLNGTIEKQTDARANVQKQVLVLTQQLERNDNLINNLNSVIATYKAKEDAEKTTVNKEANEAPSDAEKQTSPALETEHAQEMVKEEGTITTTDNTEVVPVESTETKVESAAIETTANETSEQVKTTDTDIETK